jgi:hypothetical protein
MQLHVTIHKPTSGALALLPCMLLPAGTAAPATDLSAGSQRLRPELVHPADEVLQHQVRRALLGCQGQVTRAQARQLLGALSEDSLHAGHRCQSALDM